MIIIGTYTHMAGRGPTSSTGLYIMDDKMERILPWARAENPSWVEAATLGGRPGVLAALERPTSPEDGNGSLAWFPLDTAKGGSSRDLLDPAWVVGTGGADPCHLAVWEEEGLVLGANYSGDHRGGSLFWVRIGNAEGTPAQGGFLALGENPAMSKTTGLAHPTRQLRPHAHQVSLLPDGQGARILVCDLGSDLVHCLYWSRGAERPQFDGAWCLARGQGPRHLAIHEESGSALILSELEPMLNWRPRDGGSEAQVSGIRLLDSADRRFSGGSAVRIAPGGHLLYAALRGEVNRIQVVAMGPDGRPEAVIDSFDCGGRSPRDMILIPRDDRLWLLVANQDSDGVAIHELDGTSGLPQGRPRILPCPAPTGLARL